jgi:hypothetical protein
LTDCAVGGIAEAQGGVHQLIHVMRAGVFAYGLTKEC